MKSMALGDHLQGSSSILTCACLASMFSLISFRSLPTQGRLPSMNSQAITPSAKQSTAKEWSFLFITSGAMQPGVPLVSLELFCLNSLDMPRSVILIQPCESSTRFSGLISRWMILFLWRNCRPMRMLATKNLVSFSLKQRLLPKWYLRSPPSRQSMMRQRCSRSWKAEDMLTRKGWASLVRNSFSFMTEVTDFLLMTFTLLISFIAKICLLFLCYTFHTLPKPPLPIGYSTLNIFLDTSALFAGELEVAIVLFFREKAISLTCKKPSLSLRSDMGCSKGMDSLRLGSVSFMEMLQMDTLGFWKMTEVFSSLKLMPKLPPRRCGPPLLGLLLESSVSLLYFLGERVVSTGARSWKFQKQDFLFSGLCVLGQLVCAKTDWFLVPLSRCRSRMLDINNFIQRAYQYQSQGGGIRVGDDNEQQAITVILPILRKLFLPLPISLVIIQMGNTHCCEDYKQRDYISQVQESEQFQQQSSLKFKGDKEAHNSRQEGDPEATASKPIQPEVVEPEHLSIPDLHPFVREKIQEHHYFQGESVRNTHLSRFGNDIYLGELDEEKNIPQGFGKMYRSDGSLYIGHFEKGKAQGEGVFLMPDGVVYKGHFHNNHAQGLGRYEWNDVVYEGHFSKNKFHGAGKETTKEYEFEGDYYEGNKNYGVFKWKDAEGYDYVYKGHFNFKNQFHGEGVLGEPNGTYSGAFIDGHKEGKGIYKYSNGLRYEGDYVRGVKKGKGIIYNYNNSIAYEGEFDQDMPHGKGFTYDRHGGKKESLWVKGIDSSLL